MEKVFRWCFVMGSFISLMIIIALIAVFLLIFSSPRKKNTEQIIFKTYDGYIKGHQLEQDLIKGKKYVADQLTAEGIFLKGNLTGQGKSYYKNGKVRYDGHFENGEPSGEGKLYEEDGRLKYIGNFKNGYANGFGKVFDDKGHLKIEGHFKRVSGFDQFSKDPSLPYGHCREFYSNGKMKYDGEFTNGVWHGNGKYYNSQGKLIFKGEFINGHPKS
ncbi:hypothetical protein Q5O24_05695 [Eubacteriaceae bacterium ES3]|nr:hypothetical protein Q5O24_05695 [Eubacteriaceae bacterium ES3]